MNTTARPQTLSTPAGETLVVLSLAEYQALLDRIDGDDLARQLAQVRAGEIETLSLEETKALLDAATPLAFWRRKRGLTQKELAGAIGTPQPHVAMLETGKRKGAPAEWKRIAVRLNLRMEDLIEDYHRVEVGDVPGAASRDDVSADV